jgi:hypothetical protein
VAVVEVSPETFNLVLYDSDQIAGIARELADRIGLRDDLRIRIEVDESTPLGRAIVASIDPVVITAESGALEEPKRPRQLSPTGAADVLGRLLFRIRDRLDPDFGDPPPDAELPISHSIAWDAYAVGRLVRLGFRHYDNRRRRQYHFRNRHGFSDASDEAFARLWDSEPLTWVDIVAISDGARAASTAA